jgi:hypothetical protein
MVRRPPHERAWLANAFVAKAVLWLSTTTGLRQQRLAQMLSEIPTACDRGAKCNAQGYKISWNGYKRHLDTADCGVPIAALLSSCK